MSPIRKLNQVYRDAPQHRRDEMAHIIREERRARREGRRRMPRWHPEIMRALDAVLGPRAEES